MILGLGVAITGILAATSPVLAAETTTTRGAGDLTPTGAPDNTSVGVSGEWTAHAGHLQAWHLTHDDGATTLCTNGHALHMDPQGRAHPGRCGGTLATTEDGSTTLWFDDDAGPDSETTAFDAHLMRTHGPVATPPEGQDEATAAAPLASLLGVVFTTLTFVFLASTLVLAWLYLQERRFRDYLVRRLFEETRGRLPAHWPEGRAKAQVARLVARGKN